MAPKQAPGGRPHSGEGSVTHRRQPLKSQKSLLVFLLGKKVFSVKAGLFAAALLAVDRFHHTWSYAFEPESLLLFFATLALLLYLRATETQTYRDFALLGAALGLAYLCKETVILLFPILWLHTLADPERRMSLLQGTWWMMHLVAAVVISPDLIWNATHFYEGYFYRDIDLVTTTLAISPRAVWLYLGELFVEIPAPVPYWCHWPAGAVYLLTATLALFSWRRKKLRLLCWVFWAVFLFFTVLPAREDFFWWASITLIPAVVICGEYLRRWPLPLAAVFGGYLSVQAILVTLQPGVEFPRVKASKRIESAVRLASMSTDLDWKRGRHLEEILFTNLQIAGPDARLHGYLARAAFAQQQLDRARYFARRALERDPEKSFSALVGREVEQVAYAGPSGFELELQHDWIPARVDLEEQFIPVPVSGLIDPGSGSPGRLDLAVAVNGVIEAVTQNYEGPGSSFTAMVPGTVFQADPNRVEVFVISESENGPSLASIRKRKKDALRYSLAQTASGAGEEIIVSPEGRTIRIVPSAMEGSVDIVQRHAWLWRTFVISGWASDGSHRQPADQVAVFVDGEADHYRRAVVSRSDLVEKFKSPSLEQAGFRISLPGNVFDRDPPPVVRVFAISSAGVASELQYRPEYGEGSEKRRLGEHAAEEVGYSLAEDADGLTGKDLIMAPSGATVRIADGAMDGVVDTVLQQDERTQISGWASDGSHRQPADQVAVFVDGEADHDGHAVVSRSDLVEGFKAPSLEKAGFHVILPGNVFDRDPPPVVRVFAISSAGVASELRYRPEYGEGSQKRRLGKRSAEDVSYFLAEDADGLAGKDLIMAPSGATVRIASGAMDGAVDTVLQQDERMQISGWASDGSHRRPADQVAVFVDREANHYGHAVVRRSDLVEGFKSPSLEQAGFRISLPARIFKRDPPPVVRVFAISSTGVASELRYRAEYEDGVRTVKLGKR